MVRCGVDTNILLSLYQLRSIEEFEASRAVSSLLTQNASLFCTCRTYLSYGMSVPSRSNEMALNSLPKLPTHS